MLPHVEKMQWNIWISVFRVSGEHASEIFKENRNPSLQIGKECATI